MTNRTAKYGVSQDVYRGRRRVVAAVLAASLSVVACTSNSGSTVPTTTTTNGRGTNGTGATSTGSTVPTTTPDGKGRPNPTGAQSVSRLRLSAGHSTAVAARPVAQVVGTPLDEAGVLAVESRLPAWTVQQTLTTPFNWPTESKPVPVAGNPVTVPFPPTTEAAPPAVTTGALHVLRYQPEGAVAIAPFASITFDQPMVPVETLGQLAGADVPATITPSIPGHWQWIGTSTLRFDASSDVVDRLPMATNFTVDVPAGTTSATGGVLADAVSFQFSTPAVTVQSFGPTGQGLTLTPTFVATFDQRIVPQAVLDTVVVRAADEKQPVRLVTAVELAADGHLRASVSGLPDGRWVAFAPVVALAADAAIDVQIGPGTPSEEGPSVTATAVHYTGHTYAPLMVVDVVCSYAPNCPPGSGVAIDFDNQIDATAFDPSTIQIEPPIPGAMIGVYGSTIDIQGSTKARRPYTITIPAGLRDIYGQKLAASETRSVQIGEAAPVLQQFSQPFTTLDPLSTHRSLSVVTVNHHDFRMRVFSVTPKDWPAYVLYVQQLFGGSQSSDAPAPPPWTIVDDRTVTVDNRPDESVETSVDLDRYFPGRFGHVVVIVEPSEQYGIDDPVRWMNRPTITWAQSTDIGLDALTDTGNLHAWTTQLSTGAPLPGVAVSFIDGSAVASTTDVDGLAILGLGDTPVSALLATKGDDVALLPDGFYGGSWQRQVVGDQVSWYAFDDRQTYKPGETVSIKGWVRRLNSSTDSQLRLPANGTTVAFTATDSQGVSIGTGTAAVDALGGFDFTFVVPVDANLGYSSVQLVLGGAEGISGSFQHSFQIQQFRRPDFQVGARSESVGPYVEGDPLTVAVDATYYAGGPLGAAPVDWKVSTAAASYAPPGWENYTFGVWTPWWITDTANGNRGNGGNSADGGATFDRPTLQPPCCAHGGGSEPTITQFSGVTDAGGSHYLQVDVGGIDDPRLAGLPVTVTAQATVTDVNRQAIASTTSLLVHPAADYVGLRGDRTFVDQGAPLDIEAIVTDIDGKAVPGRMLVVTATRTASVFENGAYATNQVDPQTCNVTSGTDPIMCSFTTGTGGEYTISSNVVDDSGRSSRSQLTRWVSGRVVTPTPNVEQQTLTVVPDHQKYAPGDTAQLLVQSPFATGDGLLTLSRGAIVATKRFDVVDGSAIVPVTITDADIPNVDVSIEVVGTTPRAADDGTPLPNAPLRPAFAAGGLMLSISTASRALDVTVVPRSKTVAPGTSTAVDVTVNDPSGAPVAGGQLAVVVVDEAVLALSGYTLDDPLSTFYGQLPSYLATQYGRSSIVLANPAVAASGQSQQTPATTAGSTAAGAEASATTTVPSGDQKTSAADSAIPASAPNANGGATGPGGATTPVAVRTNFDALAVFEPSVTTDSAGHATIDVPLPDNLTRYRVMVVAVAGPNMFGSAQSNITARLPLMVRPSAPRFLDFGDTFELPVVLQNQTAVDMTVDVVIQGDNLVITGDVGKEVTVPANDRVEVRFPAAAAQAGTARFRVAAASGEASDAATVELPVYTPATAEAFATYGVIDNGATAQPLVAPTGVFSQFGGLDVTTSSTSLQALTDAVLYISQYPYDSSDAMASQIIAISSLRDVLAAFQAPGLPSKATLDQTVADDVDKLVALQNSDGGFAYWEHGRPSDPFNSVEATHALVVAKTAGASVPDSAIRSASNYLANIEQHIPVEYGQQARDSLSAYALNVRMLAGDRDPTKAKALFDDRGETLPLDAIAWLWPVIDDKKASAGLERIIQNRAVDTAGAVTFTTAVTDDDYVTLRSDRRTDGLILDALIAIRPKSDLIPKIVTGLLAAQSQGRWDNIQENSFILLAMKHYFDAFESQTPEFVARVWLGDRFAGEHSFSGRSVDRADLRIPTADLMTSGAGNLTISKEGTGRLYYRIGLRTAPLNLHLQPLDRGFVVARTYEGVDDPTAATRGADGTWHIAAGARVRVRLTMVAQSQRTHVALIDPLPAGLEILNPELATTSDVPPDPQTNDGSAVIDRRGWYPTWFDHQNLRDDRAEAFTNVLAAGAYEYTYVATATTPGTFVAPPPRAEEMYAPETFGRGSSDTVIVGG